MKYCEYFDINETYFPCIDESAINAGVDWMTTYPHDTFVSLLNSVEKMLGGDSKRSVWIHGAYGTGKSQCAYALKRILEVSGDELESYWNRYEPLKKENVLLNKLLGHKERGIVTAYRYASGSIDTPQQLFLAVQESIKNALESNDISYKGERTLKESVIDWMDKPQQKAFIDSLLAKAEWQSLFSQSSADEIINTLRKDGDVSSLMDNVFRMASKEGITALSLDADKLRKWILDIVTNNNIKIVLIWDEFSDFFRLNKNSLGEFQKIVSICEEAPFYFVVVTHPISSISSNDDSWKIVQQRFDKCEISLPENIAFDLIGHAFNVKDAARNNWDQMTNGLDAYVTSSKMAVMKAANITNPLVIKHILPIHPIAALVLKNIASAFQSNQRSMFDFIKTPKNMDVKAFQWFIKEYGPMDDHPLLTVDMLWDFFYVKGKEYLSSDIKLILDTFPQQNALNEKEKTVLKTILIMQAIDQRLGGALLVLKPTDQNISYAFEGIDELEGSAKNIAQALVNKGVLISTPIGDGKKVYSAAVLAGDSAKIENNKNDIRKQSTTVKLVQEGQLLSTSLSLTPPLKLRYALNVDTGALPVVTISDFIKSMDVLKSKDVNWRFYAVLALAKDEDEAQQFRTLIRKTIANEAYKNIIVIDALSTPLGLEAFEQYVDYSAMALYYQGNNNQQSKDNQRKAKDVLDRTWRDRIHDGQFYVYTYTNQEGERASGANNVHAILQTIVLNRFRHVQDFTRALTETQLKLTTAKPVARHGIGGTEISGLIRGCEKSVLGSVWGREKYWEIAELRENSIVIVKKALDSLIEQAFSEVGQISINSICDYLQDEFGFSPCNLTAFIIGFLLKEYSSDPYRCINAEGYPEAMTPEKLAEMIGNYIGKPSAKATYIVKMTNDEKAFYEVTEDAWGIPATNCSSPSQACQLLLNKMRDFGYPVWALEYVDNGYFEIVKKYIQLVQSQGNSTHNLAKEIGKIALQKPTLAKNLQELLTVEKCKEGMWNFLKAFENGKLMALADRIGAKDKVLLDVKRIFSVAYSALWIGATGETEIHKLMVEYEVVDVTNQLLNVACNSKDKAFDSWREVLKFAGFSCDALKAKKPYLEKVLSYLVKIDNYEDIIPDTMGAFLRELQEQGAALKEVLGDSLTVFCELYAPYLEEFTLEEKEEIKNSININLFRTVATVSNQAVKTAAENYRKNQIKIQMVNKWRNLTGTKTPREWSAKYQTPILCCVDEAKYAQAKQAFSVLNGSVQSENDIKATLAFMDENSDFFTKIADEKFRNECFTCKIMGEYKAFLPDLYKVREDLERLALDVYEWSDNPMVKTKIRMMADAAYNAGGSDKALKLIDGMSDAELKKRLKELVKKDIELGVKIILNGGN